MTPHVEKFLAAKSSKSASTVAGYRVSLEHFLKVAGDDWPPDEDTITAFFVTARKEGLAQGTVHLRYRSLKAFFNWCVKRRIIALADNPMLYIEEPPKPTKRIPRGPKPGDVDKLLSWLSDAVEMAVKHETLTTDWLVVRDFAIVSLMAGTGLRVGELQHVEVTDVELDQCRVYLSETKTNIARYVRFSKTVRGDLALWLDVRGRLPVSHIPELFVSDMVQSERDWHALTHEGVRQMLQRRCKSLAIRPYLNPHAFRHYWAIAALRNGASLLDVRNQLGHSDIATTNIYLTAAGVDVKILEKLPR